MSTRPDNRPAAYIWDALTAARNARLILAEVSLDGYVGNLLWSLRPSVKWRSLERLFATFGESMRIWLDEYRTRTRSLVCVTSLCMAMHR